MLEKKDIILDAAFAVFAQYGYRRTTMEDIAQAAGLSRTALYQHWRNKDELFRALAVRYFDDAVQAMQDVLQRSAGPVADTLMAAFAAKDGKFMQVVMTTPHGPELLEAGMQVTADIALAGDRRCRDVLSAWLADLPVPAAIGSATDVADTIMASLKGLKYAAKSMDDIVAGQARLARLLAHALASGADRP